MAAGGPGRNGTQGACPDGAFSGSATGRPPSVAVGLSRGSVAPATADEFLFFSRVVCVCLFWAISFHNRLFFVIFPSTTPPPLHFLRFFLFFGRLRWSDGVALVDASRLLDDAPGYLVFFKKIRSSLDLVFLFGVAGHDPGVEAVRRCAHGRRPVRGPQRELSDFPFHFLAIVCFFCCC